MDIPVQSVHIGQEIAKRIKFLKISKSEFGRRIDVPQQHVNRLLERETMETSRLVKVCAALDFNFFTLFCPMQREIHAYLSAVTLNGDPVNCVGEEALSAELQRTQSDVKGKDDEISLLKEKNDGKDLRIEELKERIEELKGRISNLESNLKDKDSIIQLKDTMIKLLEERRQ